VLEKQAERIEHLFSSNALLLGGVWHASPAPRPTHPDLPDVVWHRHPRQPPRVPLSSLGPQHDVPPAHRTAHRVDSPRGALYGDEMGLRWSHMVRRCRRLNSNCSGFIQTLEQDLHTTCLGASTVRAQPRYGNRGRPGPGVRPDQIIYQIDGALASAFTARQALMDQHSCFSLATDALDNTQLPLQEVLEGYTGQVHVERGFRLRRLVGCFRILLGFTSWVRQAID
jgi:hypothetical protein